ncbi:6-O-methylguanine DNA methyltransferase [Delphinella strobiligena]|nr:6-O-methylguanine DNA methyltransferase [Delphinella strobiligena]
MPRSDEAAAWTAAVYNAVREIPYGKVTTYGHIARLIGKPECPRQVGVSLKHLPSATDQPYGYYNSANVPWQRVINAKGSISPRGTSGGAARQATALRAEGVEVGRGSLGEYTVDLTTQGWFPSVLPSDLGEEESSDDETDS